MDELGIHFEVEEHKIKWLNKKKREDVWRLEGEAERLDDWDTTILSYKDKVNSKEYEIIHQYLQSLRNGMKQALYIDSSECESPSCSYDNLTSKRDVLDYVSYTCQFGRDMIFPKHLHIENVQTPYQNLTFYQDDQNKDTCFSLGKNTSLFCHGGVTTTLSMRLTPASK